MVPTQRSDMPSGVDFYLSAAGEFEPLREPRACRALRRLRGHNRDDYLLIEIAPPLIGQYFELGSKDITLLVLSPKHPGTTLQSISEWPFHVYVSRLKSNQEPEGNSFTAEDIEFIAWASLYPTYPKAEPLKQGVIARLRHGIMRLFSVRGGGVSSSRMS
jgi:hypothetical protein